jgi:hypothetical protein
MPGTTKPLESRLEPFGDIMSKFNEQLAYNLGFIHGLELGYEENPYDPEDYPKLTHQYRLGYDAGVSEYCRINHPEEYEL